MADSRTFPRGGIQAPDGKELTLGRPIANASVPPVAVIPLRQHGGPPAACVVSVGQEVEEGALIGTPTDALSASVHASIPGTVRAVGEARMADGSLSPAVTVELGGAFSLSGRAPQVRPWRAMQQAELLAAVRALGVVGLGGQGIPLHTKYRPHGSRRVDALIVNAFDGDPYLTADLGLLSEKPREVAEGVLVAVRILDPARVVLAVGERSAAAGRRLEEALRDLGGKASLEVLADRYPQGEERQLAATLLGEETPRAVPLRDRGIVVSCVATLFALYEAAALGKPLLERVLTVTGGGVRSPRNLKVRFGTPFSALFEECGGISGRPGRTVVGGPLRGHALAEAGAPVTKLSTGVVVLPPRDSWRGREGACVRCGRCVDVCPYGLSPYLLARLAEAGRSGALAREGAGECAECGCCAYVCPARIPLLRPLRAGRKAIGAVHVR